jgi:hypothetical protein
MAETDRAHGRGAPVAYLPQVRRPVARRTGWAAGSIGRAGPKQERAKVWGFPRFPAGVTRVALAQAAGGSLMSSATTANSVQLLADALLGVESRLS